MLRSPHPQPALSAAPPTVRPASPLRIGRVVLGLWLVAAVVVCLWRARHWPLVNDGALQHYISFLRDSGMAPYRQLLDMNLPGSLMADWAIVHTLGYSPAAWRLFDLLLVVAAAAAMLAIAWPVDWFAGLFAASLFALLHARDGMGQTGQRDVMEAVLLLAMVAFVLRSVRSPDLRALFGAGLCSGAAAIIKPDSVLLAAILLGLVLTAQERDRRRVTQSLLFALTGFLLPLLTVLAFLLQQHALRAFFLSLLEVTPYYASLGRQGVGELLRDCLSTPMRVLLAITVAIALTSRKTWSRERSILAISVLWGLASFFFQGKGYIYHRYPTLAFLLLWSGMECSQTVKQRGALRLLGTAGLLYGALIVAPLSLVRAGRATWNESLINSLQADLTQLGGQQLSGRVQCIDSISGCNTTLLRMRLRQQTGMLSDFLIFGPEDTPAVRRTRATFWSEITAQPPTVVIITSWLHPAASDDYRKLALWPAFSSFLSTRYELRVQRSFAPGQNGPLAYRIYVLR